MQKFRSIESAVKFIDNEINEQLHNNGERVVMSINNKLFFGAGSSIWIHVALARAAGLYVKPKIEVINHGLDWLELRPMIKYLLRIDGYLKLIK